MKLKKILISFECENKKIFKATINMKKVNLFVNDDISKEELNVFFENVLSNY